MSTEDQRIIQGGLPCEVARNVVSTDPDTGEQVMRQETERVFVREVTLDEVLEGQYVTLLQDDYTGCLAWLLDKPREWFKSLTRKSWQTLRETEAQVNFDFALAEVRAAWERGQKLKFIDEAAAERAKLMLQMAGVAAPAHTQTSQPTTSGQPRAPRGPKSEDSLSRRSRTSSPVSVQPTPATT